MGNDPAEITPTELEATIAKLASWHTRNTNSLELVEAAHWIADRYRAIPGMEVNLMKYSIVEGPRVPTSKEVLQVVATLPASQDCASGEGASAAVLMGAHFDTLNMSQDPLKGRAPGANDDGSGIAATLAVARVLASRKHSRPYMFVAFSGEEQGLVGSAALAKKLSGNNVPLEAVLNNDMIGNTDNLSDQSDAHRVRVFSEENENHRSRELARWMEWLQRTAGDEDLSIKLVFRPDRFGRGGDHTPFNRNGYTAVRLVEMHEEYSRQHTELDLPEAMNFDYLARVARLNLLAMKTLGVAGPSPTDVRVDRRQSHDAAITWTAHLGTSYRVFWRDTTDPCWTNSQTVGETNHIEFKRLSKDENVFGVAAENGFPVIAK